MLRRILGGLCLSGVALVCSAEADPFGIYPFQLPEKYQSELKDYRTQWDRLTGFEHSGLHWQQFIAVFINKDAGVYENNYSEYLRYYQDSEEDEDEAEEPAFKPYSPGTIVLKENFDASSGTPHVPLSVTMMIKREPGYDSASGDWQYVQFDKSGKIILDGNAQDDVVNSTCAACHSNISDRDYVFANFYSKRKTK